jgi:hypothetical protein
MNDEFGNALNAETVGDVKWAKYEFEHVALGDARLEK